MVAPQLIPYLENVSDGHGIPEMIEAIVKVIDKIDKEKENVNIEIIKTAGDLSEDAEVCQKCNFCDKETSDKNHYQAKLCQPGKFYCRFCLRHGYNNKDNRHILMLSLRGVLGYFFWQFYYGPSKPYMWLSEIKDYITLHENRTKKPPLQL
jgi:hypothetical protein